MARRKGRDVSGILLLDKPTGMTSNGALQKVKWLYQAAKAGHTGSLDPMACGMLPICLGEATKFSSHLLDADKWYRAVCKLGVRTNTGDADGEVIATLAVQDISPETLDSVIARFTGPILQIPPMHSALKRDGVPLYRLAHRGEEVEREARPVTIHRLSVVRLEGDELEIDVKCSKGTYIRTLGEDIGAALGCGAHLIYLRRTGVEPFAGQPMVTLERLQAMASEDRAALDALLLPVDAALCDWPVVTLSADAAFYLGRGQAVFVSQAPKGGQVRLYGPDERFMGIGECLEDGKIAPRRLVNLA